MVQLHFCDTSVEQDIRCRLCGSSERIRAPEDPPGFDGATECPSCGLCFHMECQYDASSKISRDSEWTDEEFVSFLTRELQKHCSHNSVLSFQNLVAEDGTRPLLCQWCVELSDSNVF